MLCRKKHLPILILVSLQNVLIDHAVASNVTYKDQNLDEHKLNRIANPNDGKNRRYMHKIMCK